MQQVIERLEVKPKQGAAYNVNGHHGKRNPIRSDTGPILQALVFAKQPTSVLEIGTGIGLSGLYICSKLPLGAYFVSIEYDAAAAEASREAFSEAKAPAKVFTGDAKSVITEVMVPLQKRFDMVFLDANKDGYFNQISLLLRNRLLKRNCLVVADNTIDRADEMRDFLVLARSYDAVTIPTVCGLTVFTVK